MGRKKRKEGVFRKKVHKFLFNLSLFSKNEIFFSRKIRQFETKFLLLHLIKHNFPFIPPHCGVHIAQSRGTAPTLRRKRSLTCWTIGTLPYPYPIEIASKDAVPPNRETFARLRNAPWDWYGKKEEQRDVFFHKKGGTRLLWPTRFGQSHSFLVLPLCGESDHHYLIFGGLAFWKRKPEVLF